MAFMCRPSPVFIEIAQKIAVWNGTWGSYDGTFGTYYQTRGMAWCVRSLAHAIFLTPDGDSWKQAGRSALFRNSQMLKTFQDDPKSVLGFVWDYSPTNVYDFVAARWRHRIYSAAMATPLSGHRTSQGGQRKVARLARNNRPWLQLPTGSRRSRFDTSTNQAAASGASFTTRRRSAATERR